MIFGLVGVLPGAILYSVSLQFVGRSIESWFDVNVESALESGLELGRSSFEISQREFLSSGKQLANQPALNQVKSNQALLNFCKVIPTDQLSLADNLGRELYSVNCTHQEVIDNPIGQELLADLKKNLNASSIEEYGNANNVETYQLNAFYILENK